MNVQNPETTIRLSRENYKRLAQLKLDHSFPSFDAVMEHVLKVYVKAVKK